MAFAYWAGVHGLASLSITVPYFPQSIQESTLDIMMESFIEHGPVEAPDWAADVPVLVRDESSELRAAS